MSMDYAYTKPRGPIAAMYSSPGPCYSLPGLVGQNTHDPRSVHGKAPAFAFGVRHGKLTDDCSPGPAYLPDSKQFRDGKDGTPHYSLYSRIKPLSTFKTPGPGAYKPETAGPTSHFHAAQYSFGTRHRHRRTDNTPAPNSYDLPGMLGETKQSGKRQAPCYSMRGRSNTGSFHEDLQKTPGPGTYNTTVPDINKDKAPHYSMTSRNMMPGDSTQKPGPGAHSPEKVVINKPIARSSYMGIRHTPYMAMLICEPRD